MRDVSLKAPARPGLSFCINALIRLVKQAQAAAFFEPEIDHFVMAITAAEATVQRIPLSIERLELPQRLGADMLCTWLCIGTACAGFLGGGLLVLLAARLPTDKHTAL